MPVKPIPGVMLAGSDDMGRSRRGEAPALADPDFGLESWSTGVVHPSPDSPLIWLRAKALSEPRRHKSRSTARSRDRSRNHNCDPEWCERPETPKYAGPYFLNRADSRFCSLVQCMSEIRNAQHPVSVMQQWLL